MHGKLGQRFQDWWSRYQLWSWWPVAMIGLALAIRLPLLSGSLWMDEAAQALESLRPLNQQLLIRDDFQPPLLHLITHFALQVTTTEWWLRWWGALLPALITLWYLPKLILVAFGSKSTTTNQALIPHLTATLASLWLATNSFHSFFSQELRPYSLATAWAVVSWYVLLKRHPSWQFVVASLLGLYSTYLYPFVLIGQVFYVYIWDSTSRLTHLKRLGLIALGFAPWLPSFWGQLQAGQQLRLDLPGWDQVVSFSQLKVIPLVLGKVFFGIVELDTTWRFGLKAGVLGMLLGSLSWLIWRTARVTTAPAWLRHQTWQLVKLLFGWGVIPVMLAWVISFWVPVVQPKRVLWLWPLVAITLGWLITTGWQLRSTLAKSLATLTLAYVLGLNLVGLSAYYQTPKLQRENWRLLQQRIATGYSPASTILVFGFPTPFASWQWYDQQTFPTISTGYLVSATPDQVHTLLDKVADYRFVLVFDYLRTLTDPHDLILESLTSSGFSGVGVIDTPNIGFVRIYARPDSLLGYTNQINVQGTCYASCGY